MKCILIAFIGLLVITGFVLGSAPGALARHAVRSSAGVASHGIPLPNLAPHTRARGSHSTVGRPGPFPFQSAKSADGLIVLHYYYRPSSFAGDFFGLAQQALADYIRPTLGYGPRNTVTIYVYNSRDDFLAGALPNDPAITGAFTDPAISTIYMPFTDYADGFSTLSHEMTHVAFHQQADAGHLQSDYALYPVWLDEGLASSDQPDYASQTVYLNNLLQQNLAYGNFIPIFSTFVWYYPSDPTTDDLSYAEARAFIKYLEATYGPTRFHQFIGVLKNGDVGYAAEVAFGADPQMLESRWEAQLGLAAPRHAPPTYPVAATPAPYYAGRLTGIAMRTTPFAVDGGGAWLFAAFLLAIGATAVILLGLGGSRLWARRMRRRYFARQTAIALALPPSPYTATGSPGSPASVPALPAAEDVPQRTRPLALLPWPEVVAQILPAPLALGIGLLWTRLDPSQSWLRDFVAGACAVLLIALGLGVLLWRAWRARRMVISYYVTLVALLAFALGTLATGQQAGIAQGQAYATATAYTLALRTLTDAHAPASNLLQVHQSWAIAAYQLADYATATTHYRAAIALASPPTAAQDMRTALLTLTDEWGTKLVGAQQYDQALGVYAAQLGDASCDKKCQTTLKDDEGSAYLAWANDLIVTRHVADGLTTLRELIQRVPASKAAATAKTVLNGGSAGLTAAWAAGKAGDTTAMNLLLESFVLQTHDPAQAALAGESDEPVTGQLSPLYLYKSSVHLYFCAFPSAKEGDAFIAHYRTDASLFKVAAATDSTGAFTVWLPPGYAYVALWEAPAQNGHDDYIYWNNTTFSVRPFTPTGAGLLVAS